MENNAETFDNVFEQADAINEITQPSNNNRTRRNMANVLEADFYKVSKLKSVYIAPAVMFFIVLLTYCVYWLSLSLMDSENFPAEMVSMLTGKGMLFSFSSNINLGVFIAIICGIFIGGEFANGTVRTTVARGADRIKIYFSKWIVTAVLVVAYTLFALLISGIFTAVKGYGEAFTGEQFGLLMRSLVLQILVNLSVASIFLMISFLCRSAGSAIGLSLGIYILSGVVISIVVSIAMFSNAKTDWMINILDYLPSNILTDACSSGTYEIGDLMRVIFMPIAYIAVSCFIGCFTFVKRDVK